MKKMVHSGIYMIKNISNNKKYIGQSYDVKTRLRKHHEALRGNYHKNKHLQSAYNKYGDDSFIFSRILNCEIDALDDYEKYYIWKYDTSNRKHGYNIQKGGQEHRFHSKETKELISNIQKGRKLSKEHVHHMKECCKGDKSVLWRNEIKIDDVVYDWNHGIPLDEMCNKYGCSIGLIYRRLKQSDNALTRSERHIFATKPLEEILELLNQGVSQRKISRDLNVPRRTIRKIQANPERFVQILQLLRD